VIPVLAVGDPMLAGGIGLEQVLIVLLKVVIAFAFLMVAVLFMVWFERKVIAGMQNRVGPNKAGPWGILQTLADGIKLFFKEDLLPEKADRFVFKLAPYLALVPAFLVFAVIPIGGDFQDGDGTVTIFGNTTYLQLADPPIGILFVLAMSSVAVYGVMLAGWASGSKYPLLGSVRASAQMVSYEAALGLSVATVVLVTGTLSTTGMVIAQNDVVNWNLVATGIVPFVVFVIAATAELNRPPFDLVEAEQERVGGFHTEYSSIRFALFFLAEFMNTVTMSAIIVTLFLGGPQPPFDWLHIPLVPGWLSGIVWFFLKLFLFLFTYVWFRATLPRLRYDQLMDLGWKLLIPLAFGWFLVITALRVARDENWNAVLVGTVAAAVAFVSYAVLVAALRVSARKRELEGTMF
jgi:NADH-quinone oxidoreductase subunit H